MSANEVGPAGVVGCNVSVLPVAASAENGVVPLLRHSNSSNGIIDTHMGAHAAEIMEQWRDANRRQSAVDSYHLDLYFDART
jgi:hypothetical protein